jgi:hypothetical protein
MTDAANTEVTEPWLTELIQRFPGRQRELTQLYHLIGKVGHPHCIPGPPIHCFTAF